MGIEDTINELRKAREDKRAADVATWKGAIGQALVSCAGVTTSQLAALPERERWVSFVGADASAVPSGAGGPVEGSVCEAWADNEGVLDVEVPRELAEDLAAWCESLGMRTGVERQPGPLSVLHVCLYRLPPEVK